MAISKTILAKFVNEMTKPDMEFIISPADPCLLYRENNLGICMIIIYVDDMLLIGHKKSIQDLQKKVEKLYQSRKRATLQNTQGVSFI